MQSFNDDGASDDYEEDGASVLPTEPAPEPEPVDTTSIQRVWIGLVVAIILALPRYSPLGLVYVPIARWFHYRTFYEEAASDIVYQWLGAVCILLIMLWDGAPLGVFGIKKPAWSMDVVTAVLAFVADSTLGMIAVDLFTDFLTTMHYKIPVPRPPFRFHEPEHSWIGVLMLIVLSLSIGLSEELTMRGYLIPRLERIVKSRFRAIVISSAIFGLWHMRQGVVMVWSTFLSGLIYGIAFVATRRLWPTVFTHAMFDLMYFMSQA